MTSGRPVFQQHTKRTEGSDTTHASHAQKALSAGCTSRNFNKSKKITQPSGAATPRDSDAHKRIAVPQAFCVLLAYTRPRPKSGKVCRSDTRPGDVCERAERSEGIVIPPPSETPLFHRVSRCVRSCWRRRVCTRFHPRKQTWAVLQAIATRAFLPRGTH